MGIFLQNGGCVEITIDGLFSAEWQVSSIKEFSEFAGSLRKNKNPNRRKRRSIINKSVGIFNVAHSLQRNNQMHPAVASDGESATILGMAMVAK